MCFSRSKKSVNVDAKIKPNGFNGTSLLKFLCRRWQYTHLQASSNAAAYIYYRSSFVGIYTISGWKKNPYEKQNDERRTREYKKCPRKQHSCIVVHSYLKHLEICTTHCVRSVLFKETARNVKIQAILRKSKGNGWYKLPRR